MEVDENQVIRVVGNVFGLGAVVTQCVLVYHDWNTIDSLGRFLVCALVFDPSLAAIWPIYWLILVPIFGM